MSRQLGTKAALAVVVVIVTVSASIDAAAQMTPVPPPPSRAPDNMRNRAGFEQMEMLNAQTMDPSNLRKSAAIYERLLSYGRCVAKINGKRAAALLAAPANSREEGLETAAIVERTSGCPSVGASLGSQMLRGSLAEAMFNREAKDMDGPLGGKVTSEAFMKAEEKRLLAFGAADPDMSLRTSCRIAGNPTAAQALLAAKHGSDAELAAIDTLYAAAPAQCGDRTRPATLNRTLLRAMVSEGLYRWSML